jgi:hypothetical protein
MHKLSTNETSTKISTQSENKPCTVLERDDPGEIKRTLTETKRLLDGVREQLSHLTMEAAPAGQANKRAALEEGEETVLKHALGSVLHNLVMFHQRIDGDQGFARAEYDLLHQAALWIGWRAYQIGGVPFMEELLAKAVEPYQEREEMLELCVGPGWFNKHRCKPGDPA